MTKKQLNRYRNSLKITEKPKHFNGWSWETPVEAGPGEKLVMIRCVNRQRVNIFVNMAVDKNHTEEVKCRHCGRLRELN